jgi:hypothetical protein
MDRAHIESLDVLKAQSDLINQREQVWKDMNQVIDILSASPCFPSLLWAWTFDVLRNTHENYQDPEFGYDEVIAEGVTLKQIFDKFWEDVDSLGLTMDSGGEILEEVVLDWMRENDFLVALDDDGWLDDVEEGTDE